MQNVTDVSYLLKKYGDYYKFANPGLRLAARDRGILDQRSQCI